MTRIVTFLGNARYLKEAIQENKLTDVFVDKSYTIGEVYYDKRVNYHYVDTGIKLSEDNQVEMINRRIRIAKMIREIISKMNDDILFLDSDVIVYGIDNLLRQLGNVDVPTSIAIQAKAKPTDFVVLFFLSTNFYLPLKWKPKLENIINDYLNNSLYTHNPVDIFIHNQLQSQILRIAGVCHYINGLKFCTWG
jgi:hypothetical protein